MVGGFLRFRTLTFHLLHRGGDDGGGDGGAECIFVVAFPVAHTVIRCHSLVTPISVFSGSRCQFTSPATLPHIYPEV